MAHAREPSGTEVLNLFYYIMGEDQAVARVEVRRQTADIIAQTVEAMTRSRALLDRLATERGDGSVRKLIVEQGR